MIFGSNIDAPFLTCCFSLSLVLNSPKFSICLCCLLFLTLLCSFVLGILVTLLSPVESRHGLLSELSVAQRENSLAKCHIHMPCEAGGWPSITSCDLVTEPAGTSRDLWMFSHLRMILPSRIEMLVTLVFVKKAFCCQHTRLWVAWE